jgi:DNA-directed RNA polymerase I, II, and III subunit RPABC2
MNLEETEKNVLDGGASDAESDAGSDAGTSAAGSDAGTSEAGTSEAGSDIANQSDFDVSEDEEVEKNPEEENPIDTSVTHPASYPISESAAAAAKTKKSKKRIVVAAEEEEEEEEEEESEGEDDGEEYLQKFDKNFRNEFVNQYHPESNTHNYEEVKLRTLITRTGETISDAGHKTLPFLTKYEKTRVLGQRAKQINAGAKPLIDNIPANAMDGYVIAKLELAQKKIPFIIKRPLPNGECEYWNLADLEWLD